MSGKGDGSIDGWVDGWGRDGWIVTGIEYPFLPID